MIERIKTAAQDVASFIRELPRVLQYPLIATLAVVLPSLTIALAGAGVSVTIALSPVILMTGILWYLATRA